MNKNPTDSEWLELLDDTEVNKKRAKAEEALKDLGGDEISYLRKRAKNDLFFLASAILEYDLLSPHLHGHLCSWLEKTRGDRYRLILKPRGHYKTTIDTIAESIQIALPNDDGVVSEYPWTLGPNVKILIAHETELGASRALFEITEAFMGKEIMLGLFPECIPTNKKQRINKTELELPRQQRHKEPTFDVIGAGGAAQGRHYHRLKLDDIIGEKARESMTIMQTTLDWFDNCNSLLTRLKIDGWDLIGTRWALSDVYAHAMRKFGIKMEGSILTAIDMNRERLPEGILSAYVRGAVEDGEPIFPEEFSMEDLDEIRKNRKVWASQYANNPLDEELTEFDSRWLRFYNVAPNGDLIIFTGKGGSERVRPYNLDRVILVDPSMGETDGSDDTAMIVTGTDHKNRVFLLEVIRKRLRPPDFIDQLFKLYTKWWPRIVSIEDVNFSGTYKYWFERECARLKIYPNIYPYKTSNRKKVVRVRGLANYGRAGQIFCLEGMYDFREEWDRFGVIAKYHLLDALAQGPEVWQGGLQEEDFRRMKNAEETLERYRSMETGY